MNDNDEFTGFLDLNNALNDFINLAGNENILNEEEKIAKEFVDDLLKLPKPRSGISKSGYTHLIDSFAYRKTNTDVTVGWGKYYGGMIENGTSRMIKRPHLKPLWNRNADKYIDNFKKRNNLI